MTWLIVLATIVVVGLAAYFFSRVAAGRGPRLVECPENDEPAAVSVNAVKAAVGGRLELSRCSRWPERGQCGRECLTQIERSDDGCLVRTMVTSWYDGKSCVMCGRAIGDVDWLDRKPALAGPDGGLRQWQEVAPETLPTVLATHRPVCFDCYVSETFRQQHPELVIDNPWPDATRQ
ncbi:MAG TPA: hypothetical protein PKK95_01730 [Vicinamibacterales bacterium]|nr:hypothetical protein [Acidobacteriota bacterium]HOC16952.1 hypothetical protein [Vicinamibacterales bacterium]